LPSPEKIVIKYDCKSPTPYSPNNISGAAIALPGKGFSLIKASLKKTRTTFVGKMKTSNKKKARDIK